MSTNFNILVFISLFMYIGGHNCFLIRNHGLEKIHYEEGEIGRSDDTPRGLVTEELRTEIREEYSFEKFLVRL